MWLWIVLGAIVTVVCLNLVANVIVKKFHKKISDYAFQLGQVPESYSAFFFSRAGILDLRARVAKSDLAFLESDEQYRTFGFKICQIYTTELISRGIIDDYFKPIADELVENFREQAYATINTASSTKQEVEDAVFTLRRLGFANSLADVAEYLGDLFVEGQHARQDIRTAYHWYLHAMGLAENDSAIGKATRLKSDHPEIEAYEEDFRFLEREVYIQSFKRNVYLEDWEKHFC